VVWQAWPSFFNEFALPEVPPPPLPRSPSRGTIPPDIFTQCVSRGLEIRTTRYNRLRDAVRRMLCRRMAPRRRRCCASAFSRPCRERRVELYRGRREGLSCLPQPCSSSRRRVPPCPQPVCPPRVREREVDITLLSAYGSPPLSRPLSLFFFFSLLTRHARFCRHPAHCHCLCLHAHMVERHGCMGREVLFFLQGPRQAGQIGRMKCSWYRYARCQRRAGRGWKNEGRGK